ncbi:tRNA pseudouridine synthase-like 1 [Branchiostoma floridae]|uniref:tRNA pseudouridine synthase n=1 Tax=Branchiostoma floridae TaxID=7739 RepID=A0A9J7HUY0_BRAFL|nr:tRNA pseudouridine synthase-like 1 [Branchiostoma floridae]
MVRYLLQFQYLGTHFRGVPKVTPVERAAGFSAVEDALSDAFSHLKLAEPPNIHVSSRTDSGVHALCNTAHADLIYGDDKEPFDPDSIVHAVNRSILHMGRTDIRLMNCRPVSPTFSSRHQALGRTYLYRVVSGCYHSRLPIPEVNRSWGIKERLDIEAMQEAAKHFLGTHDFTTFRSKTPETWTKDPVKTMKVVEVRRASCFLKEHDPFCRDLEVLELIFKSRSFLYRQVRRMTGLLVAIGRGKLQPEDVCTLLAVRKIAAYPKAAQVAPAHGLYLCNVEYNEKDLVYD